MGFPSGSAFRNMLRRYTGLSPQDLRERGGSLCLAEMLTAQLASRRPGLYPGRRRARREKSAAEGGAAGGAVSDVTS
jgi:hypothetical protein